MGAGPGRFEFNPNGTRFRVFAHSARLGFTDEVIRLDATPGSIGPGPCDATIDVIDAPNKSSYCSDTTGRVKSGPVRPTRRALRARDARPRPRAGTSRTSARAAARSRRRWPSR